MDFFLWFLVTFSGIIEICHTLTSQSEVDYIASNLNIKYDIISNMRPRFFDVQLELTNSGNKKIKAGDWAIYFHHRFIESQRLRRNPDGVVVNQFVFKHIKGRIFSMGPSSNFSGIEPGTSKQINFDGWGNAICTYDIWPYWYVAAPSVEPRTIVSTANNIPTFVGPFDTKEKWKRSTEDVYNPLTPEARFAANEVNDLGQAPLPVIPTPYRDGLTRDGTRLTINTLDWAILEAPGLENETKILKEKTGIPIWSTTRSGRYIQLKKGSIPGVTNSEGYQLVSDPATQTVMITGVTDTGVFYGVQTLLALMYPDMMVPTGNITDYPRYTWRGMHFDVSRNFHGEDKVYSLLDTMATYKLNRLHLHLSDDEGWRLEIPALPELTQIGGKRCHDIDENQCLMSQYGSGPTTGTVGSGFFSVSQYRNILQYAKNLHIMVVPEFDMPGHGHAAIAAMKGRYNRLKEENMTEATEYLLHDMNDTSVYYSIQEFMDNAINPCINSTYRFLETLVSQVKQIHEGVQDLQIFNFGGDEVASDAWQNSTACDILREQLNKSSNSDLKEYYVRRLSEITARYGLNLGAWEDGLVSQNDVPYNRTSLSNKEIYVNPWQNTWELGHAKRGYRLANEGYKVIMSHGTHFYFDHAYEPDPTEWGAYWATRFTDTKKVFGFTPDDLYANIDTDIHGNAISREDICSKEGECPPLIHKDNVIGIQGQVWTETIRTTEQIHSRIFPRMLALAERAWHKSAWETEEDQSERQRQKKEDWEMFTNTLGYRELKRLDNMGIQYRVPVPGVKYQNGRLQANSAHPGLPIQYSTNDGQTWSDFYQNMPYQEGITYQFQTRSADIRRTSRVITMTMPQTGRATHIITADIYGINFNLIISVLFFFVNVM